jgi:tripeptide aminopeptidase
VANVGEEGLGNLRGTRYLFTESPFRDRLEAFATIDGTDIERITNAAIGSRRYRVTVNGPGGHSFGNWGIVNPAHAIGRIVARLADVDVPENPKTTYAVGLMGGGTSINSIPFEAWIEVDMRSESAAELKTLEEKFLEAVRRGVADENARRARSGTSLTVDLKLAGDRPVGLTAAESPLVSSFTWATKAVGASPVLESGSNDAGFPTSLGIPAIAISGGGRSGNLHSLGEWFEPEGAYKGVQRALLGILAFDSTLVRVVR